MMTVLTLVILAILGNSVKTAEAVAVAVILITMMLTWVVMLVMIMVVELMMVDSGDSQRW